MDTLKVFENEAFGRVRLIIEDGAVLFCASDVAKALGYTNPSKAIGDHCKGVTIRYTLTNGGEQAVNYITEGDVYRLIMHSNLPNAERFESWVMDDVLPSIRKHGVYAREELLDNPDLLIQVATALKQEREARKALEAENAMQAQRIAEMQPKVGYLDSILQNAGVVKVTLIAKDYGMSAQAFNALLHEKGVQYKQGGVWLLYQAHAEHGYTHSKTHKLDNGKVAMDTRWTQKGRLFLYELLKQHGILPVIER